MCRKILYVGLILTSLSSAFCQSVKSETIPLYVRDHSGLNHSSVIVHNGIPLKLNSNITDVSKLRITDANGIPVPSQFEVLSRWAANVNSLKPIQWVIVSFPAKVGSNSTARYNLDYGSGLKNTVGIQLSQDNNRIVVNTGKAIFAISKSHFSILERLIKIENGNFDTVIFDNNLESAIISVSGKTDLKSTPPDIIKVEQSGDLFTCIRVEGPFNNPPFSSLSWRYGARYLFYWHESTVEIEFYFAFPGKKDGGSFSSLNGYNRDEYVKFNKVQIKIPLQLKGAIESFVSSEPGKNAISKASPGTDYSIKQTLRDSMVSLNKYIFQTGNTSLTGALATRPFVALSGTNGGVGVSVRQMHLYEPQSIVARDTALYINIVSDSQWLSPFSAGYATFTISAQRNSINWDSVSANVVATQNSRPIVWPDRGYSSHSGLLDELWDGTDNFWAQKYWNQMNRITTSTKNKIIPFGMHGFMCYGLFPRYWGVNNYNEFGEINTWDGYFHGSTFADYHHLAANFVRQFAQSGEGELLDLYAFPAARRMLYTMIVQAPPRSTDGYGGWAPTGYGGYRSDFNSSHSYFENLYFYYYLTGDKHVVDVLLNAGKNLRKGDTRKDDGTLLPFGEGPTNKWVTTVARQPAQQNSIYWFLAHTSEDSSFFNDFFSRHHRFIARHVALLQNGGKEYAFIAQDTINQNPHSLLTEQTSMLGIYDMQQFWNLYSEFGNLKLSSDSIPISRFYNAFNNTLWDYVATVDDSSRGRPEDGWANRLNVAWKGDRIGGIIDSVRLSKVGEYLLYFSGKSCLASFMFRDAIINNDSVAFKKAQSFTHFLINGSYDDGIPWNKETALRYTRLHGAIGYLVHGLKDYQTSEVLADSLKKKSDSIPIIIPNNSKPNYFDPNKPTGDTFSVYYSGTGKISYQLSCGPAQGPLTNNPDGITQFVNEDSVTILSIKPGSNCLYDQSGIRLLLIITENDTAIDTMDVSRPVLHLSGNDSLELSPMQWTPVAASTRFDDPSMSALLTGNRIWQYNNSLMRVIQWYPNSYNQDTTWKYIEYDDTRFNTNQFDITPGRVSWVISKTGFKVPFNNGQSVDIREPFPITLRSKNWTDIAVPFNFSIPLKDIFTASSDTNISSLQIYNWEKDTTQKTFNCVPFYLKEISPVDNINSTLYPPDISTYSVYNPADHDITLNIPSSMQPKALQKKTDNKNSNDGWGVNLIMNDSSENSLSSTYMQVTQGNGKRSYYPSPPTLSPISFSVCDNERFQYGHVLYHGLNEAGFICLFKIENSSSKTITIVPKALLYGKIPDNYNVQFFNSILQKWISLSQKNSIQIPGHSKISTAIMAGSPDFIVKHSTQSPFLKTALRNCAVVQKNALRLFYIIGPNQTQKVTFEIFDLKGRTIESQKLFNVKAGSYTTTWHLKNMLGSQLYLLRMQTVDNLNVKNELRSFSFVW